jgi:hypothetical protein
MPEALSVPGCHTHVAGAQRPSQRARLLACGALLGALITGCGGGDSNKTVLPRPATVSTVRVTPTAGTVDVGSTLQLAAVALDASGITLAGKTFTWTSVTPGVATVSASGLVTGVTSGSVTMSAVADGVTGSAVVAVAVPASVRCDATTPIAIGAVVVGSLATTDCKLTDGSYADKFVHATARLDDGHRGFVSDSAGRHDGQHCRRE